MKIEKIKKLNNNKYKIVLENKETIITYDDVILKNNLLFNNELNSELINLINNETLYYDCYNKAVKYISVKLRSEKEIREYLKKYNDDYIEPIIEKLKNINLINDNNFCKSYISDKIYLTTDGPNKIRRDLLRHDIDENIIEESISKLDYNEVYEKCKKIIMKKINSNTKYSKYVLKQKINADLIDKGFEQSMIKEILDNNIKQDSNIIEKEYKKLYEKYSKKYNDEELKYIIKNKLYQKGFSIDEIKTVE